MVKKNTYKIKEDFITDVIEPISLSVGDIVKLGEEAKQEKWKGWIFATKDTDEGYVPMQIIEVLEDKNYGKIKENYIAKEINVEMGEEVVKIRSLNGWSWVKKVNKEKMDNEEEGWIPDEVMDSSDESN